jgi:enoyl-CoA hydratase/carnithine racemase
LAYEQITTRIEDGIMVLTMNRPDRLNAFTGTMMNEMIQACDAADADDSVRAIVVTGAGRAFCAGADLGAGGQTFDYKDGDAERIHRDGGGLLTLRIFELKKPIIAAVNGPAVGIGVTMTLPMDIRLCSTEARFGFVFARRGIVPEAASSWFLPRAVGINQALDWTMSGRIFPADEALQGRLVKAVYKPDELLPAAMAAAREIAQNTSAISVALTRHMMWRMLGADHPMEAHKIDSRGVQFTGKSPDAREGVTSFLEKRPPQFPGKVSKDMPPFFPWWKDPTFE